jgi:hypothetical protein
MLRENGREAAIQRGSGGLDHRVWCRERPRRICTTVMEADEVGGLGVRSDARSDWRVEQRSAAQRWGVQEARSAG